MFRCDDCGRTFEEPAIIYDDPSPIGLCLPPGHYTYLECPCCGSGYFEEVEESEEDE